MTSPAFIVTQVVYVLLGGASLRDYLRWRDRPRLVVALTFSALAGFILTEDLLALGWALPGLTALNQFLLPLHAFLLLLLVNYFQPVPRALRWTALAGLLAVTAGDLIFGAQTQGGPGLAGGVYFVVAETYAAALSVAGARRLVGVTRRRLTLAAAGSAALALVGAYLLASARWPALQPQMLWVVPVGTSLAAVCQYLCFATPAWLHEPWQYAELHRFLRLMGGHELDERRELALNELCLAGARACGGLTAAVLLAEGDTDALILHAPPSQPQMRGALPSRQGAIARAWDSRQAQVATKTADFGLPPAWLAGLEEADTLLAVPILARGRCWGLLLVFRHGQSPFVAADLRLLSLLADQVAQSLEYATLIGQLRQRTTELEQANREMESFSYSVSHDLRAPLRALDGFSLALSEDYGQLLPAQAKDYLDRIRAAAQRMGELVDDLLNLSQVTRAAMRAEPVDLSRLAQAAADELRQGQPERAVSFILQPGIAATGDTRLLRLVLTNLLGNAWKFTGQRARATIEFGVSDLAGEQVYFVRDNGAGFDMTYAGRLFGVFQRLHLTSEFPGTGIGLATVQRIVQRHGGRVWAEGAVDQGATFYFTLEPRAAEATAGETT